MLGLVVLGFVVFWLANVLYKTFRAQAVVPHPPLKSAAEHERHVAGIVDQLQRFLETREDGQKVSLRRSRPKTGLESNRTADPLYKKKTSTVDVWMLDGVLEVNTEKQTITVEPNVEMDELGRFAQAYGLVPQVLLEFPGISVGGALCGGGVESSSHNFGHFFNTVEELDVILGNGELRKGVSAKSDPELYHSLSGSMSTYAIIVKATIRCSKATSHVQIKYHHFDNWDAMAATMSALSNQTQPPEFLDGLVLGPESYMCIEAHPAPLPTGSSVVSLRKHRADEWFYWHVDTLAPTVPKHTKPKTKVLEGDASEFMTFNDYLFRFDRGAFWMAKHGLEMFYGPYASTAFIRAKYAWLCTTRQLYRILHKLGNALLARTYIIQDIICPSFRNAGELVKYNADELDIYPLWICPIRAVNEPNVHGSCGFGFPSATPKGELMVNVGIYGRPNQGKPFDAVKTNRALEAKAAELGARKMMYAQTYNKEAEFWKLYDQGLHDTNRAKYDPHGIFVGISKKLLLGEEQMQKLEGVSGQTLHYAFGPLWTWYFSLWWEWCTPYFMHKALGLHYTKDDLYKPR